MSILTGRSAQERLWMLGGVAGAFLLVLIGYALLISPQRSSTDSVNAQAAGVRSQNAALVTRIAGLRRESSQLGAYKARLAAAQAALPSAADVPAFLRSLQKLGVATNTNTVNFTVGAPTDLTPASATPTSTDTASSASTPSPTSSTPAASTSGVYGLPITAQITGSDTALNHFLAQLQEVQPRAVLITGITEGAGTSGTAGSTATGNSLQLTMQAFVAAPASPAAVPSATPTAGG